MLRQYLWRPVQEEERKKKEQENNETRTKGQKRAREIFESDDVGKIKEFLENLDEGPTF